MSEYTNNLNLFKYDTVSDAKMPFSIDTGLNNNWDVIDEIVGNISETMDNMTETINNIEETVNNTEEDSTTCLLSSEGYIKFPCGVILQWGRSTLSINSTKSVTLPIAFESTDYNVTTTWRSSTDLDDNANAYSYTATGFTLKGTSKGANDSYSSVPVTWQAMGY